MSGILSRLLGSAAAAAITDAYFNLVTLLLNTTATNGAQNNTFLDSSTNNFTITRNGNTTQGTFTPFSQTGWSNYLNGSSDYLTAAQNAAFNLGTGQFTVECWVYWNGTTLSNGGYGLINLGDGANAGVFTGWGLIMDFDFSGKPTFFRYDGSSYSYQSSTTLTANQWNHIAVSRNSSNTLSMWINGSRVFTGTVTTSFNNVNTNPLYIGRRVDGGVGGTHYFPGSISNVRVVTGTDVYGAANATITVPTSALTAVSGTALLTCQSNRFVDNSTNAFAITANGTPSVRAFSPFAPTAAYSTSVVGGSGYFDGSGDYLTAASNSAFAFGTGSFTWETWFYSTGAISRDAIFYDLGSGNTSGSFAVFTTGSTLYVRINGTGQDLTYTLTSSWLNSWHHLAVVRNGTTLTVYLDGVSVASGTRAQDVTQSSPYIGNGAGVFSGYPFLGYLSGMRVVKGTAVYTAAFTPPTAPLTAISGTSLLLSGTNAGIFDSAAKNDLETIGSSQVSTTVAKWGTTSMKFDGTDDYLISSNAVAGSVVDISSGNFTLEAWVYLNTAVTVDTQTILQWFINTSSSSSTITFTIHSSAGLRFLCIDSGGTAIVNASQGAITGWSTGTWYHVAAVRNGNVYTVYRDGVSLATTTVSGSLAPTTKLWVGASNFTGANGGLNGYLDDVRITKGYARYTANFTPPTAALPLQ